MLNEFQHYCDKIVNTAGYMSPIINSLITVIISVAVMVTYNYFTASNTPPTTRSAELCANWQRKLD